MGWEGAGLGGSWLGETAPQSSSHAAKPLALTCLLTNAPCVIRTFDRLL